MKFVILTFLFLTLHFSVFNCESDLKKDKELVDNVFNNLLEAVRTKYRNILNPYLLPDEEFDFYQTLVFFNVKVTVNLFDGKASGLLTLKKIGDFELQRLNNETIRATGKLAFPMLAFSYKAKISYYASITTNALATVHSTLIKCSMLLNETSGTVEFEQFLVDDVKDFQVHFDNNSGWMSKIVNYVISGLQKVFKNLFKDIIDRKLTEIAKAYVSTIAVEG